MKNYSKFVDGGRGNPFKAFVCVDFNKRSEEKIYLVNKNQMIFCSVGEAEGNGNCPKSLQSN
jgi:hypothetical protein